MQHVPIVIVAISRAARLVMIAHKESFGGKFFKPKILPQKSFEFKNFEFNLFNLFQGIGRLLVTLK